MTPFARFARARKTPRRAKSRGQAVVEFALILPVFLLLTLGVVDMARMFTSYISLTNGVAFAAIYAGNGSYLAWCATGGSVPCPTINAAGAAYTTSSANKVADPGNIAYQIFIESTGLTPAQIKLLPPQCKLTASPFTVGDCTSTTAGVYQSVTVSARYQFTFLTPIVTNITGPITMTASTSAAVLN
jgi:Flp pilus assembly protein TadG